MLKYVRWNELNYILNDNRFLLITVHSIHCFNIESEGQQQTQTKQGRALGFVLGITEEVLQFDKARKRLKD